MAVSVVENVPISKTFWDCEHDPFGGFITLPGQSPSIRFYQSGDAVDLFSQNGNSGYPD